MAQHPPGLERAGSSPSKIACPPVGLVQAHQREARSSCPSPIRRRCPASALRERRSSHVRTAFNSRPPEHTPARGSRSSSGHVARQRLRRAARWDPWRAPGSAPLPAMWSSITIRQRAAVDRASAGRPAAPSCRRPAALEDVAPPPCSRTVPWRITTTRSAILADQAEVVAMNSTLMRCLSFSPRQQLDLALDGHVQRGGRLVGDQQLAARRPAPSRSSRAAAGRRTSRAG